MNAYKAEHHRVRSQVKPSDPFGPPFKIPAGWRVPAADVERWMA